MQYIIKINNTRPFTTTQTYLLISMADLYTVEFYSRGNAEITINHHDIHDTIALLNGSGLLYTITIEIN